MAKSRSSGANLEDRISRLQAKKQNNISTLKTGDYVSIGGGGEYKAIYTGYVESIGKKTISVRTQSRMYGEQILRLPKNLYKAHFDSVTAKKLEHLMNKRG